MERKRAEGAHGCRNGEATIGLRGKTFTSCPALCHAVIRARQQISKERGPSIAKRGTVLGMVKTKPPAAVGCGQSRPPLRAAPSKMAGRDGETARLCQTEKLLVDHISGLLVLVRL